MVRVPPEERDNLGDRLSLISAMLEEAVELLRFTMSEVRVEADVRMQDREEDPDDHREP